jgi:hypothetical protein
MTDEKCSICRCLMDGTNQDYKLSCSHRFHTECIIDSLRHNPECPVCRDTGGIEVNHWSAWDDEEPEHSDSISHINSCASCGKNQPNSELYSTYKLISELGNEILRDKYTNLKSLNREYRKSILDLEKDISSNLEEARSVYKKNKIRIYHNIGKSEKFSNYMKISKQTKTLNGNFKRELSTYLSSMGYENDDKILSSLVYEYCKTIINSKMNSNYIFNDHIKTCSKYSLDKYKSVVVNTTDVNMEI